MWTHRSEKNVEKKSHRILFLKNTFFHALTCNSKRSLLWIQPERIYWNIMCLWWNFYWDHKCNVGKLHAMPEYARAVYEVIYFYVKVSEAFLHCTFDTFQKLSRVLYRFLCFEKNPIVMFSSWQWKTEDCFYRKRQNKRIAFSKPACRQSRKWSYSVSGKNSVTACLKRQQTSYF